MKWSQSRDEHGGLGSTTTDLDNKEEEEEEEEADESKEEDREDDYQEDDGGDKNKGVYMRGISYPIPLKLNPWGSK